MDPEEKAMLISEFQTITSMIIVSPTETGAYQFS